MWNQRCVLFVEVVGALKSCAAFVCAKIDGLVRWIRRLPRKRANGSPEARRFDSERERGDKVMPLLSLVVVDDGAEVSVECSYQRRRRVNSSKSVDLVQDAPRLLGQAREVSWMAASR